MSDLLELVFSTDTKELDEAKEKLVDLGESMPSVGEGIERLAQSFANIPGPVGLAVAAIAGFGLGLEKMVESTVESESRLLELSEAIGVPIEKLQPFMEAMELAGVSGEQLRGTMGKLSQAVGQALTQPTGQAADAFRKLGVSQAELASGDTEQILKDTAKGFDQYADSATKTAAIREVLGRQGPQIIAAMHDEAQMEQMAAQAQADYGTAVSEADAKSAKYFGETLKLGMSMFEGVAMSVTKSLLPGLQELVNQFAESGKQGGVMRDILDGLSATISVVSKVILTLLVEPIRFAIEIFKEAGVAIGASMAAISAAAHGNLSGAKDIITGLGTDLAKMGAEYQANSAKFVSALWDSTSAVKEQGTAVDANKPKFEAYNANAIKVSDTLKELAATLAAQQSIEEAAAKGLDDYKAAQDAVTISTMRLKLAKEGASKADIQIATSLIQQSTIAKQTTEDEIAGWKIINALAAENIGLTTNQTGLQKQLADIAKSSGMTESEKSVATALANSNEQLKEQAVLKKEIEAMDAMVQKNNDQEIASETLSTNALRLYNAQLKLKQTYEKDVLGKAPQEVEQLTQAFNKNNQALLANNLTLNQFNSSFQGMEAGGVKAMANLYQSATNLNTIGNQLTTTFVNGLTTAFMNMGKSGQNAFAVLATALITFVEQAILKFAILKVMIASMEAMGVSAGTINLMLGAGAVKASANGNAFSGGSVIPFADGGILTGPTMAPMALMGEAGPEAVMPLQRTASGKLGVAMTGGNGGQMGAGTNTHNNTFVINSNQNPKDIAKATKRQVNIAAKFTRGTIAQQQRPGGLLNRANMAFAR